MADNTPKNEYDDLNPQRLSGEAPEEPAAADAGTEEALMAAFRRMSGREDASSEPSGPSLNAGAQEDALFEAFRQQTRREEPSEEPEPEPSAEPEPVSQAAQEDALFEAFRQQTRREELSAEPEPEPSEEPEPEPPAEPEPVSQTAQEDALFEAFRQQMRREEPSAEPEPEPSEEPEPEPPAEPEPEPPADREDALIEAFRQQTRREEPSEEPGLPVQKEEPKKRPPANTAGVSRTVSQRQPAAPAERSVAVSRRRLRPTAQQRREMAQRTRDPDPVTIGKRLRRNQMLVYDSELDEVDYTDENDLPEVRDYLPIRFRRYGRLGLSGGLMYALCIISVSIILACLGWMFASDVLALNKDPNSAIVTIEEYAPEGDDPLTVMIDDEEVPIQVDIDQVAEELKNAGMIEYKWLFKLFSKFSHADTKIDPGTYDVSTELDYRALVTALQFGSGNQEITRITFPEGLSAAQIFALLEENHICRVVDLKEAAANYDFDYDFLDNLSTGDEGRLEGYLFPDTYDFYQGEDASVAINRFLRNLNGRFTDDMRAEARNRGYGIHEILTIASLIEKEAGSVEEMPTIASVIYNRLNAGMPLQLDTTINYIKGTSTLNISIADTQIESPYNTYLHEGLPPGPICCPGLAAIQAALEPADTDYWYFYAYDGENHFFTNYDDFMNYQNAHPIE